MVHPLLPLQIKQTMLWWKIADETQQSPNPIISLFIYRVQGGILGLCVSLKIVSSFLEFYFEA